MSDMAEAGYTEPRPKASRLGYNLRTGGKRVGVYYPGPRSLKFKAELRMKKLKVWLGRDSRLEATMIRYDIARKCRGLETIHFDHANYFQFFEYDGVVYDDKSKIDSFLEQAAICREKWTAFRDFVKGECGRIMDLAVIKIFLDGPESAPRREVGSPVQAPSTEFINSGTASCSSQPASMGCMETHIQSPPVKSIPPLDRYDAVLGSLDGQSVHKKGKEPMPAIGVENHLFPPEFGLCCNNPEAMPMTCLGLSGVCTLSPPFYMAAVEKFLMADSDSAGTN